MENNEFVKCMICGKETTQINYAHLKMHGITSQQYKEMFPGCKMRIISERSKEMLRQRNIQNNSSPEMRQKVSAALKGKPKSEEHKQALRDAKAREDKELRAKINGDNRRGKKNKKNADNQ